MEMKEYLLETFRYNDRANRMLLEKIRQLPEKKEALRFFSHLINSQDKWLKRIEMYPADPGLDWWEPAYPMEELEDRWKKSLDAWLEFLNASMEEDLFTERKFVGYDGAVWTVPLKDIALQLNYHSIHHRAQLQTIIRQQGLEPEFIDYIGTRYKRIG